MIWFFIEPILPGDDVILVDRDDQLLAARRVVSQPEENRAAVDAKVVSQAVAELLGLAAEAEGIKLHLFREVEEVASLAAVGQLMGGDELQARSAEFAFAARPPSFQRRGGVKPRSG